MRIYNRYDESASGLKREETWIEETHTIHTGSISEPNSIFEQVKNDPKWHNFKILKENEDEITYSYRRLQIRYYIECETLDELLVELNKVNMALIVSGGEPKLIDIFDDPWDE